ncbi:hypothetical protein SLS59_005477 [Nothophoma quercina]|uniref:Uncharacterized protein n=1 Tax=Nothophoma quercina TaxID=749835 RepID=A0ABR3RAM0_9PLEO
MPKAPRALSPERPHRFTTIILPDSPAESSPMTPLSPGSMSPPMSAKSFGTFIDSAPSTPAYSPRQVGEEWGNSQIAILRPMSSSSLPSSPTEPAWEMMDPVKKPDNITATEEARSLIRPKLPTAASTPLALSKPVKRTKPAALIRATTTDVPKVRKDSSVSTNEKKSLASAETTAEEDTLRKEAEAQARKLVEEEEAAAAPTAKSPPAATTKSQEVVAPEPSPKTDAAPLGKLATRMKSLLRRNTSEKKKEKKSKPAQEFDRLEDAHWSEM